MIASVVLRRPRLLVLALLLLTAALVPAAARLRLSGDIADMMPRSSLAARTFATFSQHLAAGQDLIVLVESTDSAALLAFADRYAAALRGLAEVRQVSHRVSRESVDYLRDHLLLLLSEDDQAELARRLAPAALQERARQLRATLLLPGGGALAPLLLADPLDLLPLLTRRLSAGLPVDSQSGYFRSDDGVALLIKVRPAFSPRDYERCQALLDHAAAQARSLGAEVAEGASAAGPRPTVSFTGSYAYPPYYRRLLEQDLSRSTIISVAAVLLLFALFFRALRILPVVLLPMICAGVWTAALARVVLGELNAVSMAFCSILIAIGIDLPIQLYNRLREELLQHPPAQAVRATVDALAAPALLATAGPALVFLCCALSDYRGLQQLGLLSALALTLNCAAMLLLLPGLLLWLPVRLWYGGALPDPQTRATDPTPRGAVARWLGALDRLRPGPLVPLVLLGGVLALALPLLPRVGFAPQLLQLEPDGMPPALAQAEITRRFGDRQRFLVALVEDADRDRALDRADQWLRAAERLQAQGRLRGYEALGSLLPSPATQAARLRGLARLALPAAAERLAQALRDQGFAPEAAAEFLARLRRPPTPMQQADLAGTELGFLIRGHIADLPDRRLVSVNLFATADERLPALLDDLQAVAQQAGGALTGVPLLERELLRIVRRDTIVVTSSAVGLVALLLVLYYQRARPVLATLLPLSAAWLLFGAALALLRLPLNLFNLLVVPLVIGYGIDDHVFLIHRYLALQQASPGTPVPLPALRGPAQAIVLTSLATIAGFAGLCVSHLAGLRLLGLCGALAVLCCLLAALLILPLLLSRRRA